MKVIGISICPIRPHHWKAVATIFREGIETGMATFETEVPTWKSWDEAHLPACRILAMSGNQIVGWAALSPVSSRCVYEGVAEVSVYVTANGRGSGVGQQLLSHLITASEEQGIWTLQSGIFPENSSSLRLHEKAGFRKIGYRERIGRLNGVWKDNVLMERRSKLIGNQ